MKVMEFISFDSLQMQWLRSGLTTINAQAKEKTSKINGEPATEILLVAMRFIWWTNCYDCVKAKEQKLAGTFLLP
jgi:hypothetical protein